MTSISIDNLDDNLVISQHNSENPITFRHSDSRIKLKYLRINNKSEEIKSPMIYGKIDEHITRIMLNNDYNIYILFIDFINIDNIPYFPYKLISVELII